VSLSVSVCDLLMCLCVYLHVSVFDYLCACLCTGGFVEVVQLAHCLSVCGL